MSFRLDSAGAACVNCGAGSEQTLLPFDALPVGLIPWLVGPRARALLALNRFLERSPFEIPPVTFRPNQLF